MKNTVKNINDIKSGYLVQTRDGNLYMCTRCDQNTFEKIFINNDGDFIPHSNYGYDFKNHSSNRYDIIKVYGLNEYAYKALFFDTNNRPLLWEEKPIKMTLQEIEEKLGYKVEIVSEQ